MPDTEATTTENTGLAALDDAFPHALSPEVENAVVAVGDRFLNRNTVEDYGMKPFSSI